MDVIFKRKGRKENIKYKNSKTGNSGSISVLRCYNDVTSRVPVYRVPEENLEAADNFQSYAVFRA